MAGIGDMSAKGGEEIEPDKTLAMRVMRRLLPLSKDYDGSKLLTRSDGPFVARLPREARRKDHAWAHLFGGPIESVPEAADPPEREPPRAERGEALAALERRVGELERALAAIKASLGIG